MMVLLTGTPAVAQPMPSAPRTASVAPAVEGIFDAFASRPIVAVGDQHGVAQELDLYAAIVRHPRFASEVGHLVVEFGSAAQQGAVDRYLSGDTVPYAELRKVWTDTVEGAWSYLGYMNLLAQVRATNLSLPAETKIRVWLGDPPIDWSKINSIADLTPYQLKRDAYPAELIQREILGRGKKALVIYGPAHLPRDRDRYIKGAAADPRAEAAARGFFRDLAAGSPDYATMVPAWAELIRREMPQSKLEVVSFGDLKTIAFQGKSYSGDIFILEFANANVRLGLRLNAEGKIDGVGFERLAGDGDRSIVDRVEDAFPDSVFVVAPYTGYADKACTERFERSRADWSSPALVQPVRDTALAKDLTANDCRGTERTSTADGLLYLGPASSLTISPEHSDIYLDQAFRQEISRRVKIITGQPLPPAADMREYKSAPVKLWP
jgi:hypothetical protein